jgi:SAM-dependent methyltransferase
MINLLIRVFKRFSWFKRMNAKITYEILAKHIPTEEWKFMNYGYVPTENEPPFQLPNDPHLQKYPLQMYHYLATKADIAGKTVLEVGSGRGGGANYIATHLKPASYIGLDLAQSAVDLANKHYASSTLKFIQGSAEKIPLADKSVDVVINVESCHAYGSVPAFLSETKRVLKPGGYFLMVDFRNEVKNMEILHEELKATGMKWLSHENTGTCPLAKIVWRFCRGGRLPVLQYPQRREKGLSPVCIAELMDHRLRERFRSDG